AAVTTPRRYRGLLTAALNPPGGRMLLLSKLEETLVLGEKRIDLSTNEYEGAVHPEGYRALSGFRLDPFPTWTFETEGVRLEKTVFIPHGSNTVQVEYKLLQAPAGTGPVLEVRPLIAFRDYHSTTHESDNLNRGVEERPNLASVQPYTMLPRLRFAHNADHVQLQGYWYRNFLYREERARGLDFIEDLYSPFAFSWKLSKDRDAQIIASTEVHDIREADAVRAAELKRREKLAASAPVNDPLARTLAVAADQFLAR